MQIVIFLRLSHLASSGLRVAQQGQLPFSYARQGQCNVPVVADLNPPHDFHVRGWWPCSGVGVYCRVLLSLFREHDRRYINHRPRAALLAPLCGATLASCQLMCFATVPAPTP